MKNSVIFFMGLLAFIGLSVSVKAQNIVDFGDCGANGNNLTWVLTDDSVLTVSGIGAMADYEFYWVNPANVAPWYDNYQTAFKTVIVTEGVTSIGGYAFSFCYKLDSVTLPSTLSLVGDYAFFYCYNLNAVTCFAKQPPITTGFYAFNWWVLNKLYVPFDTKEIYAADTVFVLDTMYIGWGVFPNIIEMFDEFSTTNLNLIDINFATSNLQTGDTFSLVYTVRHYTAVNDEWTDVVYFSQDSVWNLNAIEVMRVKKMRNVADTSTYKDTLVGVVPPMVEGVYHVIVRCNATPPRVQETDFSDNVLTAQNTVNVSVEPLTMDVISKRGTLSRGQQRLYKLTLLDNQTVEIFDSIGDVNTYKFFSIATDSVGHVEEMKTNFEASVQFVSDTTGIKDLEIAAYNLQVYPNPTNCLLKIVTNSEDLPANSIEIYDVIGRIQQYKIVSLKSEIVIDISHLANGMYFLKVGNRSGKFMKE